MNDETAGKTIDLMAALKASLKGEDPVAASVVRTDEEIAARNARIVAVVTAPGSELYPSKINRGMVVVFDGRTGLDACANSADDAFQQLFDEEDGRGSPGRAHLGINRESGLPTLIIESPTGVQS